MKALIRWTLFLIVGLPFQAIVYILYPLVWLYWRIAVYEKPKGDKVLAQHEQVSPDVGTKTYRLGKLLNNSDDHGAFTMFGFLDQDGLNLLLDNSYNFYRRVDDSLPQIRMVSGDVVTAWTFAATQVIPTGRLKYFIQNAASNYLKYLGTRSYDEINDGDVSNRCNNFGINYCPDSVTAKLGQPMAGPQFYTNSALFALASRDSIKWKVVFWLHWILLGGWYWAFSPVIWSKDKKLFYVRDMTMKALYVHKFIFGNRWWIRKPMEFIAFKTSNVRNDMWYAMMGIAPVYELPNSMDAFFSQREHCTSKLIEGQMNGYLGQSITNLAKQARILQYK